MVTTIPKERLELGSTVEFSPDLDRGAFFSIEQISPLPNKKVKVFLKWIKGRWVPDDPKKLFDVEVPEDFTVEDIHCAWLGIRNMERFTM